MTRKIYFLLCMLFLSVGAAAQGKYTVSGSVVDSLGQPIVGVALTEPGTSNGTSSDVDGKFKLAVSSPTATIALRAIGYRPQQIPANSPLWSRPIVMIEESQAIDAVAVVGYGTLRKTDLTGSVIMVKNDLSQIGMVNSASQMLLGKVPGLQITPGSGRPGDGAQIRIRGGASLNASNNPLIVIDGVPVADNAGAGMTNPLGAINPNDIETFSVLKDASATAIYGSRGSNGVIIITTKKGAKGGNSFRISYNSDYSVGVNSKTVQTLSGGEFREFMNEYWSGNANAMAILNQYPDVSTDWQGQIYRPAFGTNQFISAAGNVAGKHNSLGYRASFGYTYQEGTIKGSDYNRYTLNVSLAPRFLDNHLSVDVNFNGTMNDQNNVPGGVVGTSAFFDPTKPIYQDYPSGRFNGYYTVVDQSSGLPNALSANNPMALLNQEYNRDNSMRMIGNVQVDYKMHFLPELRANLNVGVDNSWGKNKNGSLVNSPQAWRDSNFPGVGRYNKWDGYRRNELLDFYLNYAKELGKHRLDVMAGYSWQHFYTSNYNWAFPNDAANEDNPYSTTWDATENYLVSFFGRINYNYANRYLITATVRNDGSSRFSESNRWGLFPSVAVGWNLAEENWLKGSTVNNLKLRASWGITGQQDLGLNDYPYIPRYNLSTQFSQYQFGPTWYNVLKPLAYDQNIKWEETTTWNVGVDLGAWDNRLTVSLDFYQKYTKDLLNMTSMAAGTNFANMVMTNVGDLENKGVELSIGGDIIRNQDWTWNVTANATWQDTKITRLTASNDPNYLGVQFGGIGVGTGTFAQIHAVGYTPSSFYLFQQVYGPDGKPMQNVVVDRNGDGKIDNSDRYVAGNPQAKVYFGWSTTLSYRNWDLSVNAHGSIGNKLYNDFRMGHATTQQAFNNQGFLTNVTPFYRETGFTGISTTEQNLSDYWLEDASFMRVDNITLGYNFKKLFGAKGPSGRISATAQNPFVVTNYSGLDPENTNGIDGVIWPRPRVFMLGLSLNF